MTLLMAQAKRKKGRKIILWANMGAIKKDKIFELADKRIILYQTQAATNVNVPDQQILE